MKRIAKLALPFLLAACGGANASGFSAASELPREPRRPDGVVVDPETKLPPAENEVRSDAKLAILRAPLDDRIAHELLGAFFRALATEDLPALAALLADDASFSPPSGGPKRKALEVYRARATRFDYFPLTRAKIFDEDKVETYRFEDFDAEHGLRTAFPTSLREDLRPTDLVLRVPIATTHTNAGRVLGDELLLIVRRDDRKELKIAAIFEDFLAW